MKEAATRSGLMALLLLVPASCGSDGPVVLPTEPPDDCCYLTLADLSALVVSREGRGVAKVTVEPVAAARECPTGKARPSQVGALWSPGVTDKLGMVDLGVWLGSDAPSGTYCIAFALTDSADAQADTVVAEGVPFLRSRVQQGGPPPSEPWFVLLRSDF